MTPTLIYLITPLVEDPATFAPSLRAATEGGAVAAVLLRLPAHDERMLIKHVKALAPIAQEAGAAVVVAVVGDTAELDLAQIATRGGADGVHAPRRGRRPGAARAARNRARRRRRRPEGRATTR